MSGERPTVAGLWADGIALAQTHAAAIVWIAAAFLFLPQLIDGVLVGATGPGQRGLTGNLATLTAALLGAYGQLAMTAILLGGPTGPRSVGEALSGALRTLPRLLMVLLIVVAFALPAMILLGIALAALGITDPQPARIAAAAPRVALVLVPALMAMIYLAGRLATVTPVLVGEGRTAWHSLRRGWELTRGHGWRLAGFIVSVVMAAVFAGTVIQLAGGAVAGLLLGRSAIATLLVSTLVGLVTAALGVVNLAGCVVAYRRLTP